MTSDPPLRLPARQRDAHKGTFGRVLLVGGSRGMSGSIALSAIAALKSGAGLVTAAVPDRCLESVAAHHPCVMTVPLPDDERGRFSLEAAAALSDKISGASVVGCGPGMTTEPGSIRIVERVLAAASVPRVLDADAINSLALFDWKDRLAAVGSQAAAGMVLTPHPGELERLTGVSSRDRQSQIDATRVLADQTGAVIVVKGGPSVVIGPGQTWTNTTGNPGMATAGSGDVLTGVVSSLLAQGLPAFDAAQLAVWAHGAAGDRAAEQQGPIGITAAEILSAIPHAMDMVQQQPG